MTKTILESRNFVILFVVSIISINLTLGTRTFELDTSWPDESIPKLPYYGSGIVLDQENNLLVLHRSRAMEGPRNETIKEDVVLVIDRTSGRILRQWGKDMFYHPHGIEVAPNGDIFVTDSRLHQVFKFQFNPNTKIWNPNPVLTIGERFVSGNDATHFCTPADVVLEPQTENFYVADGYCNSRVVKFDKEGTFLRQYTAGSTNPAAPPVPFNIVHALTLAVRKSPNTQIILDPEDVLIFVADRDNCRIQCFNSNGTFLYEITHEDLHVPKRMLFSLGHVDVNPRSSPYNANFTADFGIVYAVNGYLENGSPQVFEIGVGGSNGTVMSNFYTSPGDMNVPLAMPHDLAVSKDGMKVYVVISNSSTLTLRRFLMKVENAAGRSYRMSEILVVIMVSTCVGVCALFLG